VPELSNTPLDISNRQWTLAAGESIVLAGNNCTGFSVLAATANFEIALDDQPFCEVFAGLKYNALPGRTIQKFVIRNSSGASNTIRIMWGKGDFTDARLALIGSVAISNTWFGDLAANTGLNVTEVTVGAAATVNVNPGSSNRRVSKICNPIANLGIVRIGLSAVDATKGVELAPGETVDWPCQSSCFAHNPNAYPVTIASHSINNA